MESLNYLYNLVKPLSLVCTQRKKFLTPNVILFRVKFRKTLSVKFFKRTIKNFERTTTKRKTRCSKFFTLRVSRTYSQQLYKLRCANLHVAAMLYSGNGAANSQMLADNCNSGYSITKLVLFFCFRQKSVAQLQLSPKPIKQLPQHEQNQK